MGLSHLSPPRYCDLRMSDTEQLIEEKPVEDGSQQENYEMDSSVGEGEKRSTAEIETEAATTSGTDCKEVLNHSWRLITS